MSKQYIDDRIMAHYKQIGRLLDEQNRALDNFALAQRVGSPLVMQRHYDEYSRLVRKLDLQDAAIRRLDRAFWRLVAVEINQMGDTSNE